MNFKIF